MSVVLLSLIAFANKEYESELCNGVMVDIENQYDNYYIDKNDIIYLINKGSDDVVVGKSFGDIQLKEIENRILSSAYVKQAEVFKDLKGNLNVKANLRRPIARIIRRNNNHAYI